MPLSTSAQTLSAAMGDPEHAFHEATAGGSLADIHLWATQQELEDLGHCSSSNTNLSE
jgi:hypothetical protein